MPASTVGGLGTEHLNVLTEMTSKPVILRFLFQPKAVWEAGAGFQML